MWTRLSDGVYIYVYIYNTNYVRLMQIAIHVIRVPGGSGRLYAWGWNPNLSVCTAHNTVHMGCRLSQNYVIGKTLAMFAQSRQFVKSLGKSSVTFAKLSATLVKSSATFVKSLAMFANSLATFAKSLATFAKSSATFPKSLATPKSVCC